MKKKMLIFFKRPAIPVMKIKSNFEVYYIFKEIINISDTIYFFNEASYELSWKVSYSLLSNVKIHLILNKLYVLADKLLKI